MNNPAPSGEELNPKEIKWLQFYGVYQKESNQTCRQHRPERQVFYRTR